MGKDELSIDEFAEYVRVAAYYVWLKRPLNSQPNPDEDWLVGQEEILQSYYWVYQDEVPPQDS